MSTSQRLTPPYIEGFNAVNLSVTDNPYLKRWANELPNAEVSVTEAAREWQRGRIDNGDDKYQILLNRPVDPNLVKPVAEVGESAVFFHRKQLDGSPWPKGTKLFVHELPRRNGWST